MDVGASFQFLVDAFSREWHVLAPDWRGFGLSDVADGYWFADYIADLDALRRCIARRTSAVDLAGHSLGGNVAMHLRRRAARSACALVSLDGFGIPGRSVRTARRQARASGSTRCAIRRRSRRTPTSPPLPTGCRRTIRGCSRDKAEFLAPHWAEALPDGSARLRADPRHKLPFPTT